LRLSLSLSLVHLFFSPAVGQVPLLACVWCTDVSPKADGAAQEPKALKEREIRLDAVEKCIVMEQPADPKVGPDLTRCCLC
jgi:hypothetical protein